MCKKFLRNCKKMTAVETAQGWVESMVSREIRGAGDTINAMRRLSNRYKIPYSALWNLKYRPPKDLFVSTFQKIEAAYEAELSRAEAALAHERAITSAKTSVGEALTRAVDTLTNTGA